MSDRFKLHPSGILIGKTYKFRDYKEPYSEKTRRRIQEELKKYRD